MGVGTSLPSSPCVRSLFSARSDLILNRHRSGRVTHPRAMAVAAADDGLTDYERQRLAHVARNREYMARLGVLDLAKVVSSEKPTTAPSRKRVKREPTEPSRRSGRLLNVKPEHDGSAVDALRDDDDDDAGERRDKRGTGRIATGPAGDSSVWDSEDAALEASRQWLEDARALMLARTSAVADMPKGSRGEEATRARWRKEAVGRWGDGVPAIDAVEDWERWVKSRVGTPPPPSDLQLLQEYYAHDAWQLLVACVLMSRVRSSRVQFRRRPPIDSRPRSVRFSSLLTNYFRPVILTPRAGLELGREAQHHLRLLRQVPDPDARARGVARRRPGGHSSVGTLPRSVPVRGGGVDQGCERRGRL